MNRRPVPKTQFRSAPHRASRCAAGKGPMTMKVPPSSRKGLGRADALSAAVLILAATTQVAVAATIPGTHCDDSPPGDAIECFGVLFSGGVSSFADEVLRYDCDFQGGPCPTSAYANQDDSLGLPDDTTPGPGESVALGRGGLIEVLFVDNHLTNSGDEAPDLYVFESGPSVEDSFVAVRPTASTASMLGPAFDDNSDGYYEVGSVAGAVASLDIDTRFPGFGAGELVFDAVQVIDDPDEDGTTGNAVGADIDAVGAISSAPAEIVAIIEKPRCDGVGGVSNIQGLVWTQEPGEEIERLVSVTFDKGTESESGLDIPCCSSRGDAPKLLSGFSGVFNWCLLDPGLHTITLVFTSTSGKTLTVTRKFISYCEHPQDTFIDLGKGEEFEWKDAGDNCDSYPGGVVVCEQDADICDGQVRYEWTQATQGLALRSNCVDDGLDPPADPACSDEVVEDVGSIAD